MDIKNDENQEKEAIAPSPRNKYGLLAILSLLFSLTPFVLWLTPMLGVNFGSYSLLAGLLLPIVGLFIAVFLLTSGKNEIGKAIRIICIAAIVIPITLVILLVVFFIGIYTNTISLM